MPIFIFVRTNIIGFSFRRPWRFNLFFGAGVVSTSAADADMKRDDPKELTLGFILWTPIVVDAVDNTGRRIAALALRRNAT